MAKGRRRRAKGHDNADGKKGRAAGKSSGSGFGGFLKKRAPIYLGIVALFLIFIIPEITKTDLDDILPKFEDAERQRALDALMAYSGPDGSGFTMREAISSKIEEEFGENIYGHKNTTASASVVRVPAPQAASAEAAGGSYEVALSIDTHKGSLEYAWVVETGSGAVTSDDPPSRQLVNRVNYYD